MNRILVTGAAGFIGYHICRRLLDKNFVVVGLDNLNKYYDRKLKLARLKNLRNSSFIFEKIDIKNRKKLFAFFEKYQPTHVYHLAAQAGVRYSMQNSQAYIDSNLLGFYNILDICKALKIKHLIYASSSSVYGLNEKLPFSEKDNIDHPSNLYAATKKSNEIISHSYSYNYNLPCTGIRFFTVYGPWGRPDMALFIFTEKILKGLSINVHGHGRMLRDYTYIDDVINGLIKIMDKIPKSNNLWNAKNPGPSGSSAPWDIYNLGNGKPIELNYFISIIEKTLNKKAKCIFSEADMGEMFNTSANIDKFRKKTGFTPSISIEEGIPKFINWYKNFYK